MLASSALTLVSVGCGTFGLWRIGQDLSWTGNFVFQQGLLSHWQVWIGVAIGAQFIGWKLSRHARIATLDERAAASEQAIANV